MRDGASRCCAPQPSLSGQTERKLEASNGTQGCGQSQETQYPLSTPSLARVHNAAEHMTTCNETTSQPPLQPGVVR